MDCATLVLTPNAIGVTTHRVDPRTIEVRPENLKAAVGVFGKAILVRRRSSGQINLVDLRNERAHRTRRKVDLASVVRSARTVHVEPGQDLGDGLVSAENNLDVPRGVLRDYSDGVLGPNRRHLSEDRVSDTPFNLLDLLNRLVLGQTVKEKVHIRRGGKLFMVELAHATLRVAVFIWHRKERSCDGTARGNDIVPVQVGQGALREDIEIRLKVLDVADNRWHTGGLAVFVLQRHKVFGPRRFRLRSQITSADSDVSRAIGVEEGNDIDEIIGHGRMGRLLGEDLA